MLNREAGVGFGVLFGLYLLTVVAPTPYSRNWHKSVLALVAAPIAVMPFLVGAEFNWLVLKVFALVVGLTLLSGGDRAVASGD